MLEAYITPVLMYYLQKYVKNIQPQDLQLSFWGGDAVLKNLQLRCDVLEEELSHLPFVVTAGKIQELTIHVPWTTLGSESVEITAVNIECSAEFKNGDRSRDVRPAGVPQDAPQTATEVSSSDDHRQQATPQAQPPSGGYLQGLLSRIIHNVVFHVKNLSVRIVDGDICATVHIKALEYHNTNEQWNRQFIYSDYLQGDYSTQSQCDVSDMYITLDQLSGGGQVEVYEDPLTSSFALIVRMMSTYQQNVLKSKRLEFWCTCLDFSITPRQFCLMSRLVDRVLSLYYSSKRHRIVGVADTATPSVAATSKTDDNSSGGGWAVAKEDWREEGEDDIVTSASNVDEPKVDPPPKKEEEEQTEGGGDQTTWGQWMMSFVVSEGDPTKKSVEGEEEDSSAVVIAMPPTAEVPPEPPSFQLLVLVDELTFTFKTTQPASSHAFFSAQKRRSLPVMRVVFKGSLFRMHTNPQTQFFGVYQGFVGTEAYLIGGCMCSKFQNEMQSGNQNRNALGTQQLDSLNESLVFRMGLFGPGKPDVSRGSLFDLNWNIKDESPEQDVSLLFCPPEEFSALWFSYDYYDVGEGREREECSEVLRVGKVKGVVCPEVIHCYNQLTESLASSLEANPWRSSDYVVLGDPEARTHVGIHLSPSFLTLSANCHSSLSHVSQSEIATVTCGGHFVLSLEGCSLEGAVAMYGGDDLEDHIQHTSLQVKVPSLTLSASPKEGSSCQPLVVASQLTGNYHSQDKGAGTRRAYLQVESESLTWYAEPGVLASTAALVQSWRYPCDWLEGRVNPKEGVSPDNQDPPPTATSPSVVEIIVGRSSLELNTGVECSSRGLVIGELGGHLKCTRDGRLETFPLLFGPVNSSTMTTPDGLSAFALGRCEEYAESESVIEIFTSEPLDKDKDIKFSTVKMKSGGVLLLLSAQTLSLVSQLASLVMEVMGPIEEEKNDEEERKELYLPPLAVSEHFVPSFVSDRTEWPAQQDPILGMSTPMVVQTALSQVSNLSIEEDAEVSAYKDLSPNEKEEKQHSAAIKAEEEPTPSLDWYSKLHSTVLEVNTKPIIFVFTSEFQPSLGAPPSGSPSAVGGYPQSPIQQLQSHLMVLCAPEGKGVGSGCIREDRAPTPQAIVLSLPQLHLGSSISEVASLSEPIPRQGAKGSWPWQLQSAGLSAYTLSGDRQHHLVKPATCEATLTAAAQCVSSADSVTAGKDGARNSLAIHVNFQPLVVSVSRYQLEVVGIAISTIQQAILTQSELPFNVETKRDQTPNASELDPGLEAPGHSVMAGAVGPAHLPSPALSIISTATYPPGGGRSDEGSHSKPSERPCPRMLLWIQCTVPKVALRVYSGEEQGEERKMEVTGENLVMSWDQQEAMCEGHLSVTSLETAFLLRSKMEDADWRPAVLEGLLFSSHSPVLGKSLSAAVAQKMSLFESHVAPPTSGPAPSTHRTNPLHFATVGYRTHGAEAPHKPTRLSVAVQPFEVLLWWPAVGILTDLANALSVGPGHGSQRAAQDKIKEDTVPTKWPSLQLHTDAFRLLLPNTDASGFVTLQTDGIVGTSSLDCVPARYIVNESAYHKVKVSVRERQRPRLPAYQVDLTALSLWGCKYSEEGGVLLFPLIAKATLRLLFSPSVTLLPMDQFPFAGPKFKPILVCGHSVEVNLSSNLSVLVTPPGAELIDEISSCLESVSSNHHPGPSDDVSIHSSRPSEAYQISLSGQTCSVVMATSPSDSAQQNMSTTPLALLSLQNPVAIHRSCSTHTASSLSLLNVACSAADKLKHVHLPELFQSTGLTKAAFFSKVLLDTRQGLPLKGTSGVSPSFLTLNHTHHHTTSSQGSRPPLKQPTLSVDCGRPMKISLSQPILQRVSAFLSQLVKRRAKGIGKEEPTIPEETGCQGGGLKPTGEHSIGAQNPVGQRLSCDHQWGVSVSTNQLLFEYFGNHKNSSVGVACGWEELKVCPSKNDSLIAGFSSCWLKVRDDKRDPSKTSYLVLPASVTVKFTCHPQQSHLDGHYMIVSVSIPILQLRVSLHQLQALRSVLDSLSPSSGKGDDEEGRGRENRDKEGKGKEESATEERNIIVFQDDLRNGSLTIEEQAGEAGYALPPPGFIWFFPGGGDDTMPSMTWHYHEPRRLTHIHTMPLPFDVSMATESGFVDLSLVCLLQYFDDHCKEFVTAHKFHLSESTSTRVHIDPFSSSFSFIWRVCIQEVEWGDTDRSTTERLSELVQDSVSAVVSPAALAGCLRVDSVYMATIIPTSALKLEVGTLDVTLLNLCHTEGTCVGDFTLQTPPSASDNPSIEEEVFQMVVKDTLGRVRSLQGGGVSASLALKRVDGKYVDFQRKTWRHCCCVSNSKFKFMTYHEPLFTSQVATVPERPRTLGSTKDPTVVIANLNVDTILVDVSSSLAHSVAIASEAWLSRESPQAAIFQHYIIFNNTLEDLYFGQAGTDEVIMMQVRGCRGYSWKCIHGNHKQMLRVSMGGNTGWRWTKPFGVDREGLQCVEVCAADKQLANLYVKVEKSGGCQLMVTFLGNWFFSSMLPVNLRFKVDAVVSSQVHFSNRGGGQAKEDNPAPEDLMGLFPAHSSLPSCLASDSRFSGVSFAGVEIEDQEVWSESLPLATSKEKWSKPHILAKIPLSSDLDTVECWYSVRQMEPTTRQPSPAQVTLAPLFVVQSYLPFDVDLRLLPQPLSASGRAEVFGVPGCGECSVLMGVSVDVVYRVTVCFEEGTFVSLDGRPFSISTHLINTAPLLEEIPTFSEGSSDGTEWVDKIPTLPQTPGATNAMTWNLDPDLTYELAPVSSESFPDDKCPLGEIVATLTRTSVGTLVVHLQPRYLLLNKLPLELKVTYPPKSEEKEQLYVGKQHVVAMESDSCCAMHDSEFSLAVSWSSQSTLSSSLLSATQPLLQERAKQQSSSSDPLSATATEQVFLTGLKGLMAIVSVCHRQVGPTTVVTVKPHYYIHNRSKYNIQVSPFRLSSKALLDFSYEDLHPLMVVQPDSSEALVYWQLFGTEYPLRAISLSASEDVFSWSLPLSLRFVRHSFALPVSEHIGATVPAVLTSHEHSDGTVYLVVSSDPVPRVLVQNLCRFPVEVVESGTRGIHAVPLNLHPGHQSVYEPPTMAKVYPMILSGEEEEGEISTELRERLSNLSLRLRDSSDKLPGHLNLSGSFTPSSRTSSTSSFSGGHFGTEEEWSAPVSLDFTHDQTIQFSSGRRCFVTAHQKPHCIQVTILPTGHGEDSLPMLPMDEQEADANVTTSQKHTLQAEVKVLSVSLQDTHATTGKSQNVLALTSEGFAMEYNKDEQVAGGGRLEVTLRALQVDNELHEPACEYAVVALPHQNTEWQSTLFTPEELPLISLKVEFHCSMTHCVRHLSLKTQPLLIQVEDAMLGKLRSLSEHFVPPRILPPAPSSKRESKSYQDTPAEVLVEAGRDQFPLMVKHLEIDPLDLHINARATVRMFLSCDDLPLKFAAYNHTNVFSNWHEMSQATAAHYAAEAVWKVGWGVGSLEILGSPATLVRKIGRGVRDFFSIPYEGMTRSPAFFILGLGQGSNSLLRSIASGTIHSVTSFSTSISRNMERLSMDQRHMQELQQYRSEYQSRQQSGGSIATGFLGGITTFGHSLVSAVRGVVDQPLQEVERRRVSSSEDNQQQQQGQTAGIGSTAKDIITGVGKGVMGVVTKPVGGAMELVAHSGQGLIYGLGLSPSVVHSAVRQEKTADLGYPEGEHNLLTSLLDPTADNCPAVIVSAPTAQTANSSRQSSLVVLSGGHLMVYPKEASSTIPQQSFSLAEHHIELVRNSENPLHGREESGDGGAGAAVRGGKEELMLRVTAGKPVQSLSSDIPGVKPSDPLSSWRLPVPSLPLSPEGTQQSTWEEGTDHYGLGSIDPTLSLAAMSDGKEVLFIFCSEATATHLLTLVHHTQVHFIYGHTFFFTA